MLCPLNGMKKIGIGELKKDFSLYINLVKGGESILVLSRNQPVARIIPLQTATRDSGSSQARLERQGLIRRGTGDPEKWLAKRRPTKVPGSVLKDLLDERQKGLGDLRRPKEFFRQVQIRSDT